MGATVLLIPGFWLGAASWDAVLPPIEAAGHAVRPLTLPGLDAVAADRSGITLQDHVDAVVAAIDAVPDGERVVLVGHSGGGPIVYGAIDARPDRVTRGIYVDAGPLADGLAINDQLPIVDGEAPLPDWSSFTDADLVDLDEGLRAAFRAQAVPEPARVTSDVFVLHDLARRQVPATVIACEVSAADMQAWLEQGHPYMRELAEVPDHEIVELRTGHWPQFTRPAELGALIAEAASR